jgi:transcriptional regulator with XRE-family HTH domain
MDTDEKIRLAVREAMQKQGMTQAELAARLEIKQPAISQVLTGERSKTSELLLKILDELDLELVVQTKKKR